MSILQPTPTLPTASPTVDLRCCDCFDLLPSLPNESVDSVIIDPPYGVLKGHKIETKIDKARLFAEFWRVMKPNTFLAFFGQMPTIVEWYLEAVKAGFKFRLDVVWAKRSNSNPLLPVLRTKELIYIFSKGNVGYFETKEPYEDVKIDLYTIGLLDKEGLSRYISSLKSGNRKIKSKGTRNDVFYKGFINEGDRAPDLANISDVWSFTPQNKTSFGNNGENHEHPTVKPTKLVSRLAKLITPKNGVILDCFLGSGTTAVASVIEGFSFVGCELQKEYFDICVARVEAQKKDLQDKIMMPCLPFQ